jgi:hypothetical protein
LNKRQGGVCGWKLFGVSLEFQPQLASRPDSKKKDDPFDIWILPKSEGWQDPAKPSIQADNQLDCRGTLWEHRLVDKVSTWCYSVGENFVSGFTLPPAGEWAEELEHQIDVDYRFLK